MFGWFRRIPKQDARAKVVAVPLRARYDAAQTTDDNYRHWANADALSAKGANSPDVRRTLRNRSRYEVANNSYAKGIVLTVCDDLIGHGPLLQLRIPDATREQVAAIAAAWRNWAWEIDLADKLRTLHHARLVDGEGFAVFTYRRRHRQPISLGLKIFEADQVHDPSDMGQDPNNIDGVILGEDGEPVAYRILREHPGDLLRTRPLAFDEVPAEYVVHWFRRDRPGQVRGVPDILPALPLFAQLRRYTLAVISAAETAASFAVLLESGLNASDEIDMVEPMVTLPFEHRMMTALPRGHRASQMKAEQPTTTYDMFTKSLLREIGRCLCMPYAVAAGDASGHNYASGRLDYQIWHRSQDTTRDHLAVGPLDQIFYAWIGEAIRVLPQLFAGLPPVIDWDWDWLWKPREHVDPAKEAQAQATRLANRTETLANALAAKGEWDWEGHLRQLAAEQQLMDELGLTRATPESQQEQQPDEEEEPVNEQ